MIIDGGANVGLAIYYFKTLYPKSIIMAFEPMPELADIIKRNIERNHWENVQVFPYALDAVESEQIFYVQDSCLAGSLKKRNLEEVIIENFRKIRVHSVCLSNYIESPIDYLKLDIEGCETGVIREIRDKLRYVKNIFIEFHDGENKGDNSLAEIFSILESEGFIYNVDKSVSSAKKTRYKPMSGVGHRISEVVWARKK